MKIFTLEQEMCRKVLGGDTADNLIFVEKREARS